MASLTEIASALFALGRYMESYNGLRAEVPVTDQLDVPTEWKQAEAAHVLDVSQTVRWLVFERASLEQPWEYVQEVTH